MHSGLSGTGAQVSFQVLDINGIPLSFMENMSHDHTGGLLCATSKVLDK